jgi:hypothetical protein
LNTQKKKHWTMTLEQQILDEKKRNVKDPSYSLNIAKLLLQKSKKEENAIISLSCLEQANEYCAEYYNIQCSTNNSDNYLVNNWFHTWKQIRMEQLMLLKRLEQYNQMKKNLDIAIDICKLLLKRKNITNEQKNLFSNDQQELQFELEKIEKILVERRYGDLRNQTHISIEFKNLIEGKVVLANKDFKAGETIFEEVPLSSHCNIEDMIARDKKPFCSHCMKRFISEKELQAFDAVGTNNTSQFFKELWTGLDIKDAKCCDHCSKELYCSLECKDAAWKEYHELLCPKSGESDENLHPFVLLERLAMVQKRTNPLLIARMLALVVQQIRKHYKKEEEQSVLLLIEHSFDIFQRFIFNEEAHERDTLTIELIKEAIFMHVTDIPEDVKNIIEQQLFNISIYRSLNGLILRNASTVNPITDIHSFLENLVEKKTDLACKILRQMCQSENIDVDDNCSARTLLEKIVQSNSLQSLCITGTGILTIHNCMNHSCSPNVVTMSPYTDHKVRVVALRDIKKGEELCISYIDEMLDVKARRKALYSKYMFFCKCTRCMQESKI